MIILSHVTRLDTGIWLVIGFSGILSLTTTSNYSDVANSGTPQFTTACIKSFNLLCLHWLSPSNIFNISGASAWTTLGLAGWCLFHNYLALLCNECNNWYSSTRGIVCNNLQWALLQTANSRRKMSWWSSSYSPRTDCIENTFSCSNHISGPHRKTASSRYSIVICINIADTMWYVPNNCLTTAMLADLFHRNSCLCWLHNSGCQQTCHSMLDLRFLQQWLWRI
jgi:hypothetical protein